MPSIWRKYKILRVTVSLSIRIPSERVRSVQNTALPAYVRGTYEAGASESDSLGSNPGSTTYFLSDWPLVNNFDLPNP